MILSTSKVLLLLPLSDDSTDDFGSVEWDKSHVFEFEEGAERNSDIEIWELAAESAFWCSVVGVSSLEIGRGAWPLAISEEFNPFSEWSLE